MNSMSLKFKLLLTVLVCAGVATAEETPAKESPFLLPQVALEGNSEGNAEAKVSIGISKSNVQHLSSTALRLNYTIATSNGLATLFSASDGAYSATNPWSLGLTLTLARLSPDLSQEQALAHYAAKKAGYDACLARCSAFPDAPQDSDKTFCGLHDKKVEKDFAQWKKDLQEQMPASEPRSDTIIICTDQRIEFQKKQQAYQEALADLGRRYANDEIDETQFNTAREGLKKTLHTHRIEAFAKCLEKCKPSKIADGDQAYCREAMPPSLASRLENVASLDVVQLCPVGLSVVDKQTPSFDYWRHPRGLINLGGSIGRTKYEYLQPSATNAQVINEANNILTSWDAGASAIWLIPQRTHRTHWVSIESLAVFGRSAEASSTKVRWCTPVGNIPRGGNEADTVEQCRERALGAPQEVNTLNLALFLGSIEQKLNLYRTAAGIEAVLPLDNNSQTEFGLTFSLPTLINFASTESKYKGLLRIAPALSIVKPRTENPEVTFSISVALLGQRTLFSEDYNKL
jgi:hypothetical protein